MLGTYLPGLQENPWQDTTGIVVSPYAYPGFSPFDLPLLIPAGLVLLMLAIQGENYRSALISILAGAWIVLLPTILLVTEYAYHDLHFVPDVGWGLAVLGGLSLIIAGGITLKRGS